MKLWLPFVLIALVAAGCSTDEGASTTFAPAAPATTQPMSPTTTDAPDETVPATVETTTTTVVEIPVPVQRDPFVPLIEAIETVVAAVRGRG